MFRQHAQVLGQAFPQLEISGGNYPAPPLQAALAAALGYLQLALIALALGGPMLLQAAGVAHPPPLLQWLLDNRSAAFGVILLGNMVKQGLVTTGAFEVTLSGGGADGAAAGGQLLYSALASGGRVPPVQLIAKLLAARGLEPAPGAEALLR